ALAVVHRSERPGDVDPAAAGGAETVLQLAARVREHALPERGSVIPHGEDLPDETTPDAFFVRHAGRIRHRVVEADDPPFEIEDAEERGGRVHDVAHEVALALELVEPG